MGSLGERAGKIANKGDNNLFFKSISVISTALPTAGVKTAKTQAHKTPLSIHKWNTIFLKKFVSLSGAATTQPHLERDNIRETDTPLYSSRSISHLDGHQIVTVASYLNQNSSLGVNLFN